jgi:hypothetical protein
LLIGLAGDDPAELRRIADRLARAQASLAQRRSEAPPQPALFGLRDIWAASSPNGRAPNGSRPAQAPPQLALFDLPGAP